MKTTFLVFRTMEGLSRLLSLRLNRMIVYLNMEHVMQLSTIFLNLQRVTVTTAVIITVPKSNVKGYYFVPNVFAIILCCKWQILPSQGNKKEQISNFSMKKELRICNTPVGIFPFYLSTNVKMYIFFKDFIW